MITTIEKLPFVICWEMFIFHASVAVWIIFTLNHDYGLSTFYHDYLVIGILIQKVVLFENLIYSIFC